LSETKYVSEKKYKQLVVKVSRLKQELNDLKKLFNNCLSKREAHDIILDSKVQEQTERYYESKQ